MSRTDFAQAMGTQQNCPKDLRTALSSWMSGAINGEALIEASYIAMLDMLPEFRRRPLPSPPFAVQRYRSLTLDERRETSEVMKRKLQLDHQAFYEQENRIRHLNKVNKERVTELFAWANETKQVSATIFRIQDVMQTHADVEMVEEAEPVAV